MNPLEAIRGEHHRKAHLRCGARSTKVVDHGNVQEQDLVCTNNVGHDGDHRDAICCWRFHTFDASVPPHPEDIRRGKGCSCGSSSCKTRKILDDAGVPDPWAEAIEAELALLNTTQKAGS